MKTSELETSKYLKQSDIGEGKLVTIKKVVKANVAKEDEAPEWKGVMYFAELEKPMVLNTTNRIICERTFNSDETDDWNGQKLVLYVDENVSYGGKVTGGIRVRKPKSPGGQAPKPQSQIDDDFSDVPF